MNIHTPNFFSFIYKLRWQDILDIVLVVYLIYLAFKLIKGTRAVQLLKGLVLIIAIYYIANNFLQLKIITWIMQHAATMVIVAIPIIFQPELRRILTKIGGGILIEHTFLKGKEFFQLIDILVSTTKELSSKKIGALIVIEKQVGLEEFIEKGVRIEAILSKELLISIFIKTSPLHDGAVIIRDNKIMSASSILPLSDDVKTAFKAHLGTRHRAALGISEISDAACIVVSEETGDISLAIKGKLYRHLNQESLQEYLLEYYQQNKEDKHFSIFKLLKLYKNGNKSC